MTYEKASFFQRCQCSSKEDLIYFIQHLNYDKEEDKVEKFLLDSIQNLIHLTEEQYRDLMENDYNNPFENTGYTLQNYCLIQPKKG